MEKEFRIKDYMGLDEIREMRKEMVEKAEQLYEDEKPKEALEIIEQINELDKRVSEIEKVVENEMYKNHQEERSMKVSPFAPRATEVHESKEMRDFTRYVKTGEMRTDIKTDTGEVVVPTEIVTDIERIRDNVTTLADFVDVRNVKFGKGKVPVLKQEIPSLPKVEELQENPELAMAPYTPVEYEIDTYRGFLRISQEVAEDNRSDLVSIITEYLGRSVIATENQAILNQLEQLDTVEAVGIDGIKTALNTKLLPNYVNNVIIMNSTTFNELDLLKDNNGRYLLQDRIGDEPGKTINGVPVHVVSDKELPGSKIIIGSLKDAVTLFRRSQYNLQWTDYMHFGQGFMVAIRQDCQLRNKEAAYLLDFSIN